VRKATVAAPLLFIVLSLVLTYPMPLHLPDAVEDRQDALLNVWITAWDGHQLLSDPLHLFDANIFHPYPRTLAYSELLLGNGLLALPITAASGNPVLGYNLALLLSFVLSGMGIYLLVLALTRSHAAGSVAGLIFAFSSYRMTNLAQAQVLTTQWMPFALLSLYQLMRHPRLRHVVTFVVFFCLQALSSFYYGMLLALTIGGFVVFEFGLWVWARFSRPQGKSLHRFPLPHLLLAACCCTVILLPFALPYFQVQRDLGFERTLADSEPFSASLQQYLMVPAESVIHGRWLPSDDTPIVGGYPVDALFPGLLALLLGFWGVIRGSGRTRWFFLLLLAAAFVLSLGPRLYLAPGQPAGLDATLPYAWLYAIVPGLKALRAPVRFDAVAMLALAVLAGYGTASLLRPGTTARRWRRAGLVLLLAGLVVLESWVWPAAHVVPVAAGDTIPPVYLWMADQSEGPILELPMAFTPGGPQLEYQYFSTYHWQPSPDGYSGFIPPKHGQVIYEMDRFPWERSVSLLQSLGAHLVLVHTDRYPSSRWLEMQDLLARTPELTQIEDWGTDRVYGIQPRSFDPANLEVNVYLPPRAVAGQPYTAYLIARNLSSRSYAIQPTDTTQPTVAWLSAAGETTTAGTSADIPLVTSPEGGAMVIPLPLTAPAAPGNYQITFTEQSGPLGEWKSTGVVEVGDQGEAGDGHFPVPVQLTGWSIPSEASPGQPLDVKLVWRALGKIDAYYSFYVKLLDREGEAIAAWDGQPGNGQAPTLEWVPGETIEDSVTLAIPDSASPGDYVVEVGMYRATDLARCMTLDEDGTPVDQIVLGIVRAEP
jgi:hypothetical protein